MSASEQKSFSPLATGCIKVCGLTNAEDARLAVAAGANALGFVHYPPSPRSVELTEIRAILGQVDRPSGAGELITVLVVVDVEPAEAEAWVRAAGVDCLQLCAAPRSDLTSAERSTAERWSNFKFPLLRRVGVDSSAVAFMKLWSEIAAGFVLDHPASPGGSGQTVDWNLAARLCEQAPCLLAGGLDPDNVAQAIRAVRPHGVDASSRLESEPGRKDPMHVQAFSRRARLAFEEVVSQ